MGHLQILLKLIDIHYSCRFTRDQYPNWGRLLEWSQGQLVYKVFPFYVRLKVEQVSDRTLREAAEKTIVDSKLDRVVCLALDLVYDNRGRRREDQSHLWDDNDYIRDLQRSLGDKVLLGASVHPYDLDFKKRVNAGEMLKDFKAVLQGHFERIIVPQDNHLRCQLSGISAFLFGVSDV